VRIHDPEGALYAALARFFAGSVLPLFIIGTFAVKLFFRLLRRITPA
jgi:hypothetical protein